MKNIILSNEIEPIIEVTVSFGFSASTPLQTNLRKYAEWYKNFYYLG